MGQKNLILISAFLAAIFSSCGCSTGDKTSNADTTVPMETTKPSETSLPTESKVKFEPFNNVDDVRKKLSEVGIGELGRWRDDELGGYISITPYHQFGGGDMPNNLAYYLEGDNLSSIKTLKLVLNINNENKKAALSKFVETIGKTYRALGLGADTKIMNEAKFGQELSAESETYTAKTELEKSNIETWKFVITTK
ncbi:MAG: hypothetical protein EOP48_08380 [Sphingobacteriales bacterium]|nr:MAG: hypothetical protein EOP48_08380 [Sphingobacteriales bacterium]